MSEDPRPLQAVQRPPHDVVTLQGRNNLPISEKFEGLFRPEGKETARIRFRARRGRLLDLPLSAEALADLVQLLCSLRGFSPETSHGLAYLEERQVFSD
jgi:hypothetical protein